MQGVLEWLGSSGSSGWGGELQHLMCWEVFTSLRPQVYQESS